MRRPSHVRSEDRKAYQKIQALDRELKLRIEAQSPEIKSARVLEYDELKTAEFARLKEAYDMGHQSALWEAILSFSQLPEWVREAIVGLINGRPFKKNAGGRPKRMRHDLLLMSSVDWWRSQQIAFGKAGKARPFSWDRAFAMVQAEQKEKGLNISTAAIRAAYKRAKKRMSADPPPYINSYLEDLR